MLSNEKYTFRIAQTGESESFLRNNDAIIPVSQPLPDNLALSRSAGRYFFIRDNDSGEVWNAWWRPSNTPLERFEARHAVGSSNIESTAHEIDSAATFFVPNELPCELWQIKLRNTSSRKRRLSLFVFVQWPEDLKTSQTFFRDNTIFSLSGTDEVTSRFITLDHAADSFDCDPDQFIGRDGSLTLPRAVRDGKCSRSLAQNEPAIGVLQRTISMGAGTESFFTVMVGAVTADSEQQALHQAKRVTNKLQGTNAVQKMLEETRSYWEKRLGQNIVRTPEVEINNALNTWAKHQLLAPVIQEKTINQQLELLYLQAPLATTAVREKLLKSFSYQYHDGRLAQNFTENSAPSDDIAPLCWLIMAVINYLKESGELTFLKEQIVYRDSGKATVSEHIVRALRHCESMREATKSSYVLALYAYCLKELPAIFSATGEHDVIRHYNRLESEIKPWFERHFWKKGRVIDEASQSDDSLSFTTQFWSVYSGLLQEKKIKQAISASEKHLTTLYGIADDTHLDLVSSSSVAQYAMLLSIVGDSDGAYKYFSERLPMRQSLNPELFIGEPYLFPGAVFGPKALRKGQATTGWDTAAGGWSYKYLTEYLLGIKPTVGGLRIDPRLPRDWRQVDIAREFRGAHYHIRIQNPLRSSHQIDRIIVDGLRIAGNVIRPFGTGNHFIEVILG